MHNLSIVIPVYNEKESLQTFLPDVLSFCRTYACKLILVNDGSQDGSYEELEKAAVSDEFVTVVHHKVNRGYGGALKSGIGSCKTKYCITIDADGQHTLSDVAVLHEQILKSNADLIVGNRGTYKGENVFRKIGKMIIRKIARILLPVTIKDINSGMKIYRTHLVQRYLGLCPDSMAFSDIIALSFIQQRHLVSEYPITVLARTSGTSTINLNTAIDTVMEIINMVVLFNPMRIFLPVACVLITAGICWGIPIMMAGRGVSAGTMVGIISGLLFFFLGLMTEQLALLRRHLVIANSKYEIERP